jgi:hypothetical protein
MNNPHATFCHTHTLFLGVSRDPYVYGTLMPLVHHIIDYFEAEAFDVYRVTIRERPAISLK